MRAPRKKSGPIRLEDIEVTPALVTLITETITRAILGGTTTGIAKAFPTARRGRLDNGARGRTTRSRQATACGSSR